MINHVKNFGERSKREQKNLNVGLQSEFLISSPEPVYIYMF